MSSSPPHCSWHWHWVWCKTWNIFSYSHHAQIMWRLNCKNLFSIWISFSTEQTLQYFPRICKETFLIFGGNQDSVTLSVELLCYAGASPLTPTVVDLSDNRRECGDNTGPHTGPHSGPHSGPHTLLNIFCHWNIIALSPHTERRRQNMSWRLNTSSSSSTPRQSTGLSCLIILDSLEL